MDWGKAHEKEKKAVQIIKYNYDIYEVIKLKMLLNYDREKRK